MQGMCGAFFRAFKNEEEWGFTYSCSGAESLAQSPQGGEVSGTSPGQGFHCEISMFHPFLQYSPGNSLSMCAQSYAHEATVNLLITSPLWKRDCLCLTRSYSSYTDDSPTTRTTSYTISSSRPRWNYIIFAGAKKKTSLILRLEMIRRDEAPVLLTSPLCPQWWLHLWPEKILLQQIQVRGRAKI